jgi:hypothetical protein
MEGCTLWCLVALGGFGCFKAAQAQTPLAPAVSGPATSQTIPRMNPVQELFSRRFRSGAEAWRLQVTATFPTTQSFVLDGQPFQQSGTLLRCVKVPLGVGDVPLGKQGQLIWRVFIGQMENQPTPRWSADVVIDETGERASLLLSRGTGFSIIPLDLKASVGELTPGLEVKLAPADSPSLKAMAESTLVPSAEMLPHLPAIYNARLTRAEDGYLVTLNQGRMDKQIWQFDQPTRAWRLLRASAGARSLWTKIVSSGANEGVLELIAYQIMAPAAQSAAAPAPGSRTAGADSGTAYELFLTPLSALGQKEDAKTEMLWHGWRPSGAAPEMQGLPTSAAPVPRPPVLAPAIDPEQKTVYLGIVEGNAFWIEVLSLEGSIPELPLVELALPKTPGTGSPGEAKNSAELAQDGRTRRILPSAEMQMAIGRLSGDGLQVEMAKGNTTLGVTLKSRSHPSQRWGYNLKTAQWTLLPGS